MNAAEIAATELFLTGLDSHITRLQDHRKRIGRALGKELVRRANTKKRKRTWLYVCRNSYNPKAPPYGVKVKVAQHSREYATVKYKTLWWRLPYIGLSLDSPGEANIAINRGFSGVLRGM